MSKKRLSKTERIRREIGNGANDANGGVTRENRISNYPANAYASRRKRTCVLLLRGRKTDWTSKVYVVQNDA